MMRRSDSSSCFTLCVFLLATVGYAQITGIGNTDTISRLNQSRSTSFIGNSADTGTGSVVLARQALSVQGGRLLNFPMAYNSLLTGEAGSLGYGWSHTYEAYIGGDPGGTMVVHWDINRKNSFQYSGDGYQPLDQAVRYDKLLRLTGGSWRLTRQDGTVYVFASSGALQSIANKIGQSLQIDRANGQISALREPIARKTISLHYANDSTGLLQFLSDDADRIAFFDYDSAGRLSTVRNPVTLGAAQGGTFAARNIPNDPQGLVLTIPVTQTAPIGLVQMYQASIEASAPSGLRVYLVSPQGTQVQIPVPSGPSGNSNAVLNFSGITVDAFDGESPLGSWKVIVVDQSPGAAGRLLSWQLKFTERTDPVRYTYDANGRILMATGPDGERLFSNTYDALGRVIAQDDGVDTNMVATFSYLDTPDGGVRTTYRDRMANTQVFQHDPRNHLVSYTNAVGQTTSYRYSLDGDRTGVTDALGRSTLFNYDSNGNLIQETDPLLATTKMTYDSNHNLLSLTDALGKLTTFEYDSTNNLTAVVDAMSNHDQKIYAGNSQLSGTQRCDGAIVSYGYQNGMPVSATHPVAGYKPSSAEYDNAGRLTRLVDSDGFATLFVYNSSGQVTAETDALGKTESSAYDRKGRLVSRVDRRGNATYYDYDNNNNLIRMTDALGEVRRFRYDGEDRLIQTIDPQGHVRSVAYDAAGRAVSQTDPLGNTVTHEYDAVGNEVSVHDAYGVLIRKTVYDARNQPISVTDAAGNTVRTSYDALGRPIKIQDALGRITTRGYDDLDRLVQVRDALGRVAAQEYLIVDTLSAIVDTRKNRLQLRYDNGNRIQDITTSNFDRSTFTYNGRDEITRESFSGGRDYSYTFDGLGRVSKLVRSGPGLIVPAIYNTYDDKSNLTVVSTKAFDDITPQPRITRVFDALDRLTSQTDASGNTIRYSFDASGNLRTLTYPDRNQVSYTYDDADRLIQVKDWAGRTTSYQYDKNSNVTRITLPNGTLRVMQYDGAGRIVQRQDLTPAGAVIVEYRYTYDAAGQVVAETGSTAGAAAPFTAAAMSYDSDNRLTRVNGSTVSFDDYGNMTQGPISGAPGKFRYDHANNLIAAGSVSYFYDPEDRLVAFSSGGGTTRLAVMPGPGLSQVLMKTDPNGVVTHYVYGVGLIYEETGGKTRVHHYDQRGSTVAFTDDKGAVTGTVAYGPYGEITDSRGDTDSLFLFSGLFGAVTDPNHLNYLRFRWYSPELKRFLNRDAHVGNIGELSTLNRYSYAGGNPVSLTDPTGQNPLILVGALLGAAVGVTADLVSRGIDSAVHHKPFVAKGQEWNFVGELAGAAIGGAITGGLLGACGPACASGFGLVAGGVVAGAIGGAIGNLAKQGVRIGGNALFSHNGDVQFDSQDFAGETITSAAFGAIPFGGEGAKAEEQALARAFKPSVKKFLRYDSETATVAAAEVGTRRAALSVGRTLKEKIFSRDFLRDVGLETIQDQVANAVTADQQTPTSEEARASSRQEIYGGGKTGTYGKYAVWKFYLNVLQLADRPVPNNPNHVMATF